MRLKNYQEDVVLRAIEIALEDKPQLLEDRLYINDVAAYVLNRIPPKYIMSERGFLRLAAADLDAAGNNRSLLNIIELMIIVNRGLEVVGTRRRRVAEPEAGIPVEPTGDYVHNFPQILGRVVSGDGRHPVIGATVTLYIDGEPAKPADPGWENPYVTNDKTHGYFSFWPAAFDSAHEQTIVPLRVTIEHPDFEVASLAKSIETKGVFQRADQIYGEEIVNLGDLALSPPSQDPE